MANWVNLDGTANSRDVGGLPGPGGTWVRSGRLIRSDNLQDLSAADVAHLVTQVGIQFVADLRTPVEVSSEGPAPLDARAEVHRLSVFPEQGANTDVLVDVGPSRLPWLDRPAGRPPAEVYLGYLADRPDSMIAALRLIAAGPTVVHCAAGKDRTGVVVAPALDAVGVDRAAIVADFAATAERIEAVVARLSASPTYRQDVMSRSIDRHTPRAETMEKLLAAIDERFGGTAAWLRGHGWTDADDTALRSSLLGVRPTQPKGPAAPKR